MEILAERVRFELTGLSSSGFQVRKWPYYRESFGSSGAPECAIAQRPFPAGDAGSGPLAGVC
jgi:hypothetical protein